MKKFLLLMSVLIISSTAQAQDAPQYFTAIQDVPLMEGLRELPELTTTFDKPEGRIVESTALIELGTLASVEGFYRQTLPQLGWKAVGDNRFVRENEELRLNFEHNGQQTYIKVMVSPGG